MKSPTRQSKRKASRRGEVRAEIVYAPKCELSGCFVWSWPHGPYTRPVFVLPADAESVERMRKQLAEAYWEAIYGRNGKPSYRAQFGHPIPPDYYRQADIMLAALNLTPSKP